MAECFSGLLRGNEGSPVLPYFYPSSVLLVPLVGGFKLGPLGFGRDNEFVLYKCTAIRPHLDHIAGAFDGGSPMLHVDFKKW